MIEKLRDWLRKYKSKRSQKVSCNNLLRAFKKLKVLGNGFTVLPVGKTYMIQSVPAELSMDHTAIIQLAQVREEIEFENLAKMYLKEMIKRECWDEMSVKGRAVLAFNSNLEVSNFPMLERPQEVKKLIETVTKRRKIEIAEAKARKDIVEKVIKPLSTTAVTLFLGNVCLSYAAAFILSLAFEAPMMGLEKVLLGRGKQS